jgi:ribokinase
MTVTAPRICVVGSANMDLTFRTPRLPLPGETLIGHSFVQSFGGKGANQAVAAARLGANVSIVTRVGRDAFGEAILINFAHQGIATYAVTDPDRPTGTAAILVDDSGRNCIVAVAGANVGLSPRHVEEAADVIRGAAVLVSPLEVPIETILTAFRLAKGSGVRTVLNPAPAFPLPEELWHLVDVCVPNEVEAELLTGQVVRSVEDAEAAGRQLLGRGPKTVIVTLGERGALIVDQGRSEQVPGVAVTAVDTTGAGDAFIGGLSVFLAEGKPLREAVVLANAVGALSVTVAGAQAGLPRREELERFLAQR